MKSYLFFLLTFFLFFSASFYSQEDIPPPPDDLNINKKVKYEFERYEGTKTTKIRQGDYIQIRMKTADTTINYYGDLLRASNSEIIIKLDFIEKYIDSKNANYDQTKLFINPIYCSTSCSQIDFIAKYTARSEIGPMIGAGAFTVALFAPLAGIDKKAESGFNVKRYVTILKYTAVTAGVGIVASIILADYQRYTLKPKLISIK